MRAADYLTFTYAGSRAREARPGRRPCRPGSPCDQRM